MNMMQLKLVFIKALSRVIPICLSEISCYNVHFQNKSLENWQGHQSMKSVIRRVVCTLHRFLQKSLDYPGSNIKILFIQAGHIFWICVQRKSLERAQLFSSSGFNGSTPDSFKVRDDSFFIEIRFIVPATTDGT